MNKGKKRKKKEPIVRKIQASTMYAPDHLEFLDRKIDKGKPHLENRSAIVGFLVEKAMKDPSILSV